MKVKEIIELIDFISKKRLEEVNIETQDIKLSIKKPTGGNKVVEQIVTQQPAMSQPVAAPQPAQAAPAPAADKKEEKKASEEDNYITIKSPMIGTFYRSPNPESPSFVNVGDKVNVGDPICIIEAMKLFNEIESEVSGTVVKVLVENSTPVEYDQPLFVLDPKG